MAAKTEMRGRRTVEREDGQCTQHGQREFSICLSETWTSTKEANGRIRFDKASPTYRTDEDASTLPVVMARACWYQGRRVPHHKVCDGTMAMMME